MVEPLVTVVAAAAAGIGSRRTVGPSLVPYRVGLAARVSRGPILWKEANRTRRLRGPADTRVLNKGLRCRPHDAR